MKTKIRTMRIFVITFLLTTVLCFGINAMINNQKKALANKVTNFLVYSKRGI